MKCSNEIPKPLKNDMCNNSMPHVKSIWIQGSKFYIDGKYWGEVIEKTDNYFKVEYNNGNKYVQGDIITVKLTRYNKLSWFKNCYVSFPSDTKKDL